MKIKLFDYETANNIGRLVYGGDSASITNFDYYTDCIPMQMFGNWYEVDEFSTTDAGGFVINNYVVAPFFVEKICVD